MAPITLTLILVLVAPYALLALAGLVLWKRHRSLATMMIALGFLATFIGQAAGLHLSHEVGAAVRAHQDATLVLVQHHRIFPLLTHYAAVCGLWAAAVGMVWHAMRATPGHNADDDMFKRQSHSTDPWLKKVGYFRKWWQRRSRSRGA